MNCISNPFHHNRLKQNVVFRIRSTDDKYTASLKESLTNSVERDGSITRYSREIDMPSKDAIEVLKNPSSLLDLDGDLFKYVKSLGLKDVKYLGSYVNNRVEIPWNGKCIILDTVEYPFGRAYECEISKITVGTDISEDFQSQFEQILKDLNIYERYAKGSKIQNLLAGKVL